jgi:predicted nuclease with TOPRIM domain
MSSWKYEFKGYKLELVDEPRATSEGEVPDLDYLLAEIDAEVSRLQALIQKSEDEIYRLRKWQRVSKKAEK